MDCGPTCVRMIAEYYGQSYPLDFLREQSYITREGVSMLGISKCAESIGFKTQGVRLNWEQLRDQATLPIIIHWNENHFVVVYKIDRIKNNLLSKKFDSERIHIADPAHGRITLQRDEFLKHWKNKDEKEGMALLIEPASDFYNHDQTQKKKPNYKFLYPYIRPHSKFIIQLLLAGFIGSIISLAFPFLTQSIVDYGIKNNDLSFIVLVLIAQMILTFGQTVNGFIRNWIMLYVTTRISISLISGFLTKLMKLPISFFDVKMIGDIIQRIGDHERVQSFLTGSLINIFFSVITLIMYTFIMAQYDLGILGIFYLGSFLYVLWILLFLKKRRNLDYKRFHESSANQSNIVQLISGMQEIKLNNCEKQKRWQWERIQVKLFKVKIKNLVLDQNQQLGSTFIEQTKNIFISFLSAKAVIDGDMTLGMMMAVQYIIGQLNAPIQQFIGFTRTAQDAKISLERLGEIHDRKDEEAPEDGLINTIPTNNDIIINNLTFQYEGPFSEKVLEDIHLKIPANKITAIVGASGSGKTTLIKLLLGFYKPTNGEILLNGRPLDQYSPTQWRRHCGVVMQDGFIFSDSIADNISLVDEVPQQNEIESAVKKANLQNFIQGLPLGYNTKIGNDGHGLSSGQKQRILIARAIYKNPDYLFFDEATNALDASNERIIMENLNRFFKGRTVVVIAHRLSTVKNADKIVVLENGKIAEIGNHTQLVNQKGAYFRLVKDQLELGN